MSRIPAPAYSENNANSYRLSMMGDNYSNDMGDGSTNQDPQVSQYIEYMHRYETMLMSYRQSHLNDPQALATVDQYLATSHQYLASVGDTEWDPMMGGDMGGYSPMMGDGNGMPGNGTDPIPSANPGLTMDFQDSQKVIYGENEEVSSYIADKQISQPEVHFYNYGEMTFNVPGAASCQVGMESGVMVATVTWPATGATKKYYFHNNEKVNFTATNAERQITIDTSVPADKVTKADAGAETEQVHGTPPDATDAHAHTRTWNTNDTVDYQVTQGTEQDNIYADTTNITLQNRSQRANVLKLGDHEYEVTITNADGTGQVRKIHLYQARHVNIHGAPPENVSYGTPVAGGGASYVRWDLIPTHDSQITVGATDSTDSPPATQVQGDEPTRTGDDGKRIWDGSSFDIYSRSDSKENEISARNEVHFHATSNTEYWTVEWDNTAHQYLVKVYDDPTDRTDAHLKETFRVNDMTHLKLSFDIDPSHIEFKNTLGTGEGHHDINTSDVQAQKLSMGTGETPTTEDSSNSTLEALKTALGGKTDAQILAALNANGFHFANIDALKTAMNATPATFPPAFSTTLGSDFEHLIKALYALDGQLSGSVNGLHRANSDQYISNGRQATSRLVSLLQALYPDHNISPTYTSTSDNTQSHFNDITFDGTRFNYTRDQSTSGDNNTWDTIEVSAVTGDN